MSTKKIICREMDRAAKIVDKIFAKQLQWKDLFSKHTFFTTGYKYYLSVIAASRSKEAQLIWSGLVESKVRLLVTALEHVESIELAHPFVKGFDRVHHCQTEDEVEKIANGDLQFQQTNGIVTEPTDLVNDQKSSGVAQGDPEQAETQNGNGEQQAKREAQHIVYTTTYYIGIEIVQGFVPNPDLPCRFLMEHRWHEAT